MNKMKAWWKIPALWAALLALLAASAAPAQAKVRLTVAVSVPPVAFLVQKVAGDAARVKVILRPGQEPHEFSPTPRLLASLSRGVVFFSIGLPLEDKIASKLGFASAASGMAAIDRGVKRIPLAGHGHGHGRRQARAETDPHIWLSPVTAAVLARNAARELAARLPGQKKAIAVRLAALSAQLKAVDGLLRRILAPYKGRAFFVYHPAFSYFARQYGLKQVSVELEGKSPTARQLAGVIKLARQQKAGVIFVQPQFPAGPAGILARATGARVRRLDPLAYDLIANLKKIGATLARAWDRKGDAK